jgi:hypothetical protein
MPQEHKQVMTLCVEGLKVYPREIQHDGETYPVISVSAKDELEESARLRSLLKSLVFDHEVDAETLNSIGFSREDASNLGMTIEGLVNVNIPPRSEWNE